MAEGKRSFILYSDIYHTVKKLTDIQAGKLFKHILSYVNDENPNSDDIIIQIAFEPIKQSLKRDLQHWEKIRGIRSASGKKGGRPRKEEKAKKANAYFEKQKKQTKAKKAVSVNDNVNDSVNVNEENNKQIKSADFIDQIINIFVQEHGDYEIINKGKERAAAGKLINIFKNKYPDANTEEILNGMKIYFQKCLNIDDPWLRDNMSIPIIISKFNEINKILKHGKSTGKNKGATWQDIAELTARNEAIDRD